MPWPLPLDNLILTISARTSRVQRFLAVVLLSPPETGFDPGQEFDGRSDVRPLATAHLSISTGPGIRIEVPTEECPYSELIHPLSCCADVSAAQPPHRCEAPERNKDCVDRLSGSLRVLGVFVHLRSRYLVNNLLPERRVW